MSNSGQKRVIDCENECDQHASKICKTEAESTPISAIPESSSSARQRTLTCFKYNPACRCLTSDGMKRDLRAELEKRLAKTKHDFEVLGKKLDEMGKEEKEVVEYSEEWYEQCEIFYEEFKKYEYAKEMIKQFKNAILTLDGKVEVICAKIGFYLGCTCAYTYYRHPWGSASRAGSCIPCIARERDRFLAPDCNLSFGTNQILRSQITGPSECRCVHCIAKNWESINDRSLSDLFSCTESCRKAILTIEDACDLCLFKIIAHQNASL
jgi:hypothetical protein